MCDLRFACPFNLLVAGSSQTGKTEWVRRLLEKAEELYSLKPGPFIFYYREWQPIFDLMPNVEFRQGMPTMEDLKEVSRQNATIVIDDLMHKATAETAELFTVGSSRHHVNIIFIVQNLFEKNPCFRTISLNCKYICIRKNPRDTSSISYFARQVVPSNPSFLTAVYKEVTGKKPYSYIFFDASQNTPEHLRIRTNVLFENELPMQCFVIK